jgi:hypothetical protein
MNMAMAPIHYLAMIFSFKVLLWIPMRVRLSPLLNCLWSPNHSFTRLKDLLEPVICDHPRFGIEVADCDMRDRSYLLLIFPNTTAAKSRVWRRFYVGAYSV